MSEETTLHVLSWNVDGLEMQRLDRRMENICLEIVLGIPLKDAMAGKPSPPLPHVICLQEVVRRAHLSKIGPHLSAAGFELFPPQPIKEESEYSMLAVRAPWRLVGAKTVGFTHSPLARDFIEAELEHSSGARARVLTAHMESLRSGSEARLEQALELDERLHAEPAIPAIFAGDTNLRQREKAAGFRAVDAFVIAGAPQRHAHTWWPPESGRGFRFDQIWFDSQRPWTVRRFRTRRRAKLSDHAAIEAHLCW